MNQDKQFADVALPVPIYQLFTYSVPKPLQESVDIGIRVLVPFGKRHMTGFIVAFSTIPRVSKVKAIMDVIDDNPMISSELLLLAEWIASYYANEDVTIPLAGAYFYPDIAKLRKEGRVLRLPPQKHLPALSYWDVGFSDYTVCWVFQPDGPRINVIHCYKTNGKKSDYLMNYINEWGKIHGVNFIAHLLPHDGNSHNTQTGHTCYEMGIKLGMPVRLLPRPKSNMLKIEAIRKMLPKCWFDESCEHGLYALESYHAEFSESMGELKATPKHDWTSHYADAFAYFSAYFNYAIINPRPIKRDSW